ncbi:MAG: SET domain-containing protein [Rudaea sp.]|uniref:SET domain-containing protein-lysine N-methyltransferase n=1 Tax=unclassified Rudaea TaxID=2627037 RepID=UPI0010F49183|nr:MULTISPECIES: SET domain-containing protein [unclassified Rudaea]MBN8886402.1 SET domain-containing protein [Rudaea sp.]MBR0346297.1 SET domain-containing protein [Rudaea sp.]
MILPKYHVAPSLIPGAGKGLFLDEPVARGRLVTAPDDIRKVYKWDEVEALPNAQELLAATVRWFEDRYTVTPEWPDECYINHSFAPNGLWHLGFVFALRDLVPGEEITVDYRHLLAPGQKEDFVDATTGGEIIGHSWAESLALSSAQLHEIVVMPRFAQSSADCG